MMEDNQKFLRNDETRDSGPLDGVEILTECSVVKFDVDKSGNPVRIKECPKIHKCLLMAACSENVVALSVRDIGFMATIRMEDMKELLCQATVSENSIEK